MFEQSMESKYVGLLQAWIHKIANESGQLFQLNECKSGHLVGKCPHLTGRFLSVIECLCIEMHSDENSCMCFCVRPKHIKRIRNVFGSSNLQLNKDGAGI